MGKKILLAEDSLTIRKVFEFAFAQTDLTLTSVDNGTDAVRLAMETSPDLLIADVTLPGKDGFEVGEEIRSSEKMKSCPVLILSGSIAPFDEERFKKCGAAGVLFKPFESHDMLEKIQELLRGPEEAVHQEKGVTMPAADEPWDFSDVLDEVSRAGGKAAAPGPSKGEDLMPGAPFQGEKAGKEMSLGEFDVSLEEIEESPGKGPELAREGEVPELSTHIEGDLFTDAPAAVTDLSRSVEAVEEIEEIEDLDEVDTLLKGFVAPESAAPEAPVSPPPETAAPEATPSGLPLVSEASVPAPVPTAVPVPVSPRSVSAPPEASKAPATPEAPPETDTAALADRAIRDQFAVRANEIFERVAAETVEKVLWESMDRFSVELSTKIRECVETVAWEVIPSTAETLIREEITRIRQRTEKKST